MSAITQAGLDGLQWHPRFTIEKYSPEQTCYARGKADGYRLHPRFGKYVPGFLPGDWLRTLFPYPDLGTLHGEGNGVTAGGLDNLAMVLTGTGGYPLAPGRVAFGVGTHPGEFDIEQARLGGEDGENPGRTWYRPMDHGYPQPAVGGIEGQATFAEDEACFDWHEWCATSMTEILTRAGWKRYDELVIGEDVLTLDCDTRMSHWQPLQNVHVWPNRVRRMRVFDSARGLRSVTTADHRWPVLRNSELQWCTSEELTENDRIIRAVPHDGFPAEAKYLDSFVRLIAHYWCDGWVHRRSRPSLQGGMGAAREDKLASMRKGLSALPPGSWGENRRVSDGTTLFRFNKAAMEILQAVAPGHVPSYAFLADLTEAQLRLFTDVCLRLGDGSQDGGRGTRPYFSQTDKHGDGAGRFQFLCALQGIATNTLESAPSAGRFTSRPVYKVRPLASSSVAVRNCGDQGWTDVEDVVWCPQTADTTWLARDRGSVYWTGNCWAAGPVAPVQHHALHHSYSGQGGLMINRKGSEAGYGLKEPGVAWVFRVNVSLR